MASTAVSVDSACLSLQRRVNDLEQENKALKDWSEEAKKYEPKSLRGIATVYVKKSTAKDDEDPYWLCSNCFVKGEMSIIQKEANLADVSFHLDADSWICNSCKGKYGIPKHLTPLV